MEKPTTKEIVEAVKAKKRLAKKFGIDEANWHGENRLGKVLDQVRQMLLDGYKAEIKY